MKLTTLKPRLSAIVTQRVPTLPSGNQAPRPAGRRWQETRERIQARDGSMCTDCGLLWMAHRDHVDHETPRWKGGSDEDSNLRLRCIKCHKAKTDAEAAERARGG